ncbi:hypothetical protein BDR07DRAFT_1378860 [Suillus spraguei]|nr:hypothetical protein BDR07DRAFT_1378860 [Suillus spraguei]
MIAVLIVVVIGSINDWQKEQQFKVVNEKKEERGVKVIRNGIERLIDIKEVVVGDIALSEHREIVPCNGIFLAEHNVMYDESAATSESDAIKKASSSMWCPLRGARIYTTDCFVVSGSKVLEDDGSCVVVAVGTKSFNGRIMMGSPARSAHQNCMTFVQVLIISVTLVVVAVPEAFSTKRMTAENLLVPVLGSCETMGNSFVICIDKTVSALVRGWLDDEVDRGLVVSACVDDLWQDIRTADITAVHYGSTKPLSITTPENNGGADITSASCVAENSQGATSRHTIRLIEDSGIGLKLNDDGSLDALARVVDSGKTRIVTLYQIVHDAIHSKSGQTGSLKLQYIRTEKEIVMAWLQMTQPFEFGWTYR